jgi:hypothetical protein
MKIYIDQTETVSEMSRVSFHVNIATPKEDVIALFLISSFDDNGNFGVHTWYSLNSELLTTGELR